MSKPEEIPADVWSSAESALDDMLCNCIEASGTAEQFRIDSIVPIARALMAAKAEQRETDAQIAEHHADENGESEYCQGCGEIIADAIRKGGAA